MREEKGRSTGPTLPSAIARERRNTKWFPLMGRQAGGGGLWGAREDQLDSHVPAGAAVDAIWSRGRRNFSAAHSGRPMNMGTQE